MNVASFVDRDMVMRYFGGGIGHLKNTPPLQVPGFDPIDPSFEEVAVEDDNNDNDGPCSSTKEDLGAVVQRPSRDFVMNGGGLVQLEVGEDDEDDEDDEDNNEDNEDNNEDNEDSDNDEGEDQADDDEDGEGEDDYGYASAWTY